MTPIAIRAHLVQALEKFAQEQGTDVASLVNEWVERQFALARDQKIRAESVRFRAPHSRLRTAYLSEYVAMQTGEVLDHAPDVHQLYLRIKERVGDEPTLIAPVTDAPTPLFQLRSPRLAGPSA